MYRDRYGFPHILGSDDAALVFAHAAAQMEDAPFSVLAAVARASGRLSETLGLARPEGSADNDPYVRADIEARLFRHPEQGRRLLRRAPPTVRRWMAAFAAGIRYYRRSHYSELLQRFVTGPCALSEEAGRALLGLPVRAQQIAALDHHVAAMGEIERVSQRTAAPQSSNALAVSASRSATGHALLLADPHVPFEAVPELRLLITCLHGRRIRAAGLVRPGAVLPSLGWFGRLALAVASNWPATAWRLHCPRRGARITLFGRSYRLRKRRITLQVRGWGPFAVTLHHVGREDWPVLHLDAREACVAVTATQSAGALTEQTYRLMTARDPGRALRRSLSVPGHPSLSYHVARSDGGIEYCWNALVPAQAAGEGSPFDLRVDLPGKEVRRPPGPRLPLSRLPWLRRGLLIANANASYDHLGGESAGRFEEFPEAVRGAGLSLTSFRHQRTLQWLELRGRRRLGMKGLERLALDVGHLRGEAFVQVLEGLPEGAPADAVVKALRVLGRWDGQASVTSRECALLEIWLALARHALGEDVFGRFDRPELFRGIPKGVPAALAGALAEAHRLWRAWRRPRWGDLHGVALPAHAGGDWLPVPGTGHTNRAAEVLEPPPRHLFAAGSPPVRFPVGQGQAGVLVIGLGSPPRIRFRKAVPNREGDPDRTLTRFWAAGEFRDLEILRRPGQSWTLEAWVRRNRKGYALQRAGPRDRG
ncbi:MAG: penicillin acylase family protein [Planctomycetota bacterium]